jgi:hypothetical protein
MYVKVKSEKDAIRKAEKVIARSHMLEPVLKEIKKLKRGCVKAHETKKRSALARNFSVEVQSILNYINEHKIKVNEELLGKLWETREKAEAVLRENIVLHTKPPLDVVKIQEIPVRYLTGPNNKREQRMGLALHKKPFDELGYALSVAFMPPKYQQLFHSHTVPECTLMLDKKCIGIYKNGLKEKKL